MSIYKQGTDRIERLRENYLCRPSVCFERAQYFTESYKETEGQQGDYRKAKAFQKYMEKRTIFINDDDLIVGTNTSKTKGAHVLVELRSDWQAAELPGMHERPLDRYEKVSEEDLEHFNEVILPYWRGKSQYDRYLGIVPAELRKIDYIACRSFTSCGSNIYGGHISVDHERYLKLGVKGIMKQVSDELKKCDFGTKENYEKVLLLRAMLIELDAVITLANRYADEAERLASKETNAARKGELIEIARICRKVPENPSETFQEAMQAVWFLHIALQTDGSSYGYSYNRIDQYLLPYFRKDIEAGTLTEDEAKELICELLVKNNDFVILQNSVFARSSTGFPMTSTWMVGGMDADGKDAVNELTYVIVDAEKIVALPMDDVCVRISHVNPDEYVEKTLEVAKDLGGKLKFFSDDTSIKMLLSDGKTLEQARNYSVCGCWELNGAHTWDAMVGYFNPALMLELALNNGVRRITGDQFGPQTGDPRKFKSIDEIWEAYRQQCLACYPLMTMYQNVEECVRRELGPVPFMDSMFEPCVENGIEAYQLKNNTIKGISLTGIPNIGDSMAAVQRLVFDEKKYTMEELIDALDASFEGYDEMLRDIEAVPKFGNDDDFVDEMVDKALEITSTEFAKFSNYEGTEYRTGAAGATSNIYFGSLVGATPDGRRAADSLAEGGMSPQSGRNVSGPMATFRSLAKLDLVKAKTTHGLVANLRLGNDAVKSEKELKKLTAMVRTYMETGGYHIQFNFTDNETLRAAQKNPENYKDLLVRVATYSSFFVELGKELQDDIIERSVFASV